jgi:tetratricopeptide (TPR) repeat protein
MRYSAFITYSHADTKWANWLHHALETYRIPKHLHGQDSPAGPIGPRLRPVFRDRDEMASAADLTQALLTALNESAALIVLCSPAAARSKWVNKEIQSFHTQNPGRPILCCIVDGVANARRRPGFDPAQDCFPPMLQDLGFTSPVAADVRPGTDGKDGAKLRLIAGLLNVGYDDLRQREAQRQQRRWMGIAVASMLGTALTSGLAIYALIQRSAAIEQRDIAREKSITTARTIDFVKSIFTVADPSESKGQTITAREILDRGTRRIEQSLDTEPNVKAELMTTLADVYGGLGLFKQSDALIRKSMTIKGVDDGIAVNQLVAMGESQLRLGDYQQAIRLFEQALSAQEQLDPSDAEFRARVLVRLSTAQASLDQFRQADASGRQALESAKRVNNPSASLEAQAYEALGLSALYANNLDVAKTWYQLALHQRMERDGALHPKTSENLSNLGSIAYLQGLPKQAEGYFRRAMDIDGKTLGALHPDGATNRQNLARVLLEQRKFSDAAVLLTDAVSALLKERSATHDDAAFVFANLAMAQEGLGQTAQAEASFRTALTAARLHKHRNLAPILTDLAGNLCTQKRFADAFAMLAEAAPIMAKTYPNDPWRSAWTEQTRGSCLVASGRIAEGRAAIRASAQAMQERWPVTSFYGDAVARNLRK